MTTPRPSPRIPISALAAHPWHGVSPGDAAPDVVTCYVEIVPTDTVKYEVDKTPLASCLESPRRYRSTTRSDLLHNQGLIDHLFIGRTIEKEWAPVLTDLVKARKDN